MIVFVQLTMLTHTYIYSQVCAGTGTCLYVEYAVGLSVEDSAIERFHNDLMKILNQDKH